MADAVVVGGGSAGCVLAARLSEDAACQVILLEAGQDLARQADMPPDVLDASGPTLAHDWGYLAEPDPRGRRKALPRARLIGGCSATNGCFAVRGAPADYDGWAQLGNPGWSFEEVLPFFCRLEADADFGDEWHGRDGPLPIHRHPRADLNPVQAAFIDAACTYGLPYAADHNRPGAIGVGPVPRNARNGVRMSTALTYLASSRGRPNLTVRGGAVADRVEVHGGAATGVRLADGEIVPADRVVLAAGTYASPAILQRSGIGPAAQLRSLGIGVVADLPGVGENLTDHPPGRRRSTSPAQDHRAPLPDHGHRALPAGTRWRCSRPAPVRRWALRRQQSCQPHRRGVRNSSRARSAPFPGVGAVAVRRSRRRAAH